MKSTGKPQRPSTYGGISVDVLQIIYENSKIMITYARENAKDYKKYYHCIIDKITNEVIFISNLLNCKIRAFNKYGYQNNSISNYYNTGILYSNIDKTEKF